MSGSENYIDCWFFWKLCETGDEELTSKLLFYRISPPRWTSVVDIASRWGRPKVGMAPAAPPLHFSRRTNRKWGGKEGENKMRPSHTLPTSTYIITSLNHNYYVHRAHVDRLPSSTWSCPPWSSVALLLLISFHQIDEQLLKNLSCLFKQLLKI